MKFWTFLSIVILATSVAVCLLDLGIKASILEEAGRLRRAIEAEHERQAETIPSGTSHNGSDPTGVLDLNATGMETENVWRVPTEKISTPRPARSRRANTKSRVNNPEVPDGN